MQKTWIHFATLLLCVTSFAAGSAQAQEDRISEAEFLGATLAGEEVLHWIYGMEKMPNSLSILSSRTKAPLAEDFAGVMETEIYKNLSRIDGLRVQSCPNCRTPRVKLMGDRLVITKGTPDIDTLKRLGREQQVESFLLVEAYRTSLSLMVVANLYATGSGEVIDSKTFRIPMLEFGGGATMVLGTAGLGVKIGGASSQGSAPPLGVGMAILEELGFGKGGLALGAVASSGSSALAYLTPTVGWRNRLGSTGLYSLTTLGLGYGYSGRAGIVPRFSYEVMIGSFTNIGVEALGFLPLVSNGSGQSINGYLGLHIGFVLGR